MFGYRRTYIDIDGLAGEDIPTASRILLVTDAFDAMTTDRPYRKAMPVETAIEELRRNSGTQFDPDVVEAFLKMLSDDGLCPLLSAAVPEGRPVQIPKVEMPKPPEKKPAAKTASTDRIAGVKTFFTKLHPGAMNFLDEQITKWLTENPDVQVKRTNVSTGQVQAKKTEPNIIINVWY